MISFKGVQAVVTGGTRGIGRALVELLRGYECEVLYTGTHPVDRAPVPGARYHQLDVTQEESITAFLEHLQPLKGSIDILVNNAGITVLEPVDAITLEDWERVLRVNLTAPMRIMRAIIPLMSASGGRIVNVSSIWGVLSKPKRGSYSASKAGLIGLTRAAALDLAPSKILVNAVCPGFTRTELTASALSKEEIEDISLQIPLGRLAEPREIAETIAFLCSDENTYITGQTIVIDGGFTIR